MSTCYYGVVGFGFAVKDLDLNFGAILDKLDSDWVQKALDEEDIEPDKLKDYLDGATNSVTEFVSERSWDLLTDRMNDGKNREIFGEEIAIELIDDGSYNYYLYCPALMPWEIQTSVRNLNKEEVSALIVDAILPFTHNTREELMDLIDDINTSGQG